MENGDALYAICKLKAPLLAYLFESNVLVDPSSGKRINGQWYKTQIAVDNGRQYQWKTLRWLGGHFSCEHGRDRYICKECGGNGICEHGRQRRMCKDCGGNGICEHGRSRSKCKECGGGSICEHGRERSQCKECGGGSICEHGRRRSQCKECKTKS